MSLKVSFEGQMFEKNKLYPTTKYKPYLYQAKYNYIQKKLVLIFFVWTIPIIAV
jgi:hypothetical protein